MNPLRSFSDLSNPPHPLFASQSFRIMAALRASSANRSGGAAGGAVTGTATFEHLDAYLTPVETEVAEPVLAVPTVVSVSDVVARLAVPAPQRWPPRTAAARFPFGPSLLSDHCRWMIDRLPPEYVVRYWLRSGRTALPGIGHLHFLYGADCPALPVQHFDPAEDDGPADGPVALATDLCLCDCPLLSSRRTDENAPDDDDAVVTFAARCVSAAAEWTPYPDDTFPTGPLALLGAHWPDDARPALTAVLRSADRRSEWLIRLLETTGVASDLPIRLLQYAVFRYSPERLPDPTGITVGWHVARAAAYGGGPLAGSIPRGAVLELHGAVESVPVWRAVASYLRSRSSVGAPCVALCVSLCLADVIDVIQSCPTCLIIGPIADHHTHPSCVAVWPRLDMVLLCAATA